MYSDQDLFYPSMPELKQCHSVKNQLVRFLDNCQSRLYIFKLVVFSFGLNWGQNWGKIGLRATWPIQEAEEKLKNTANAESIFSLTLN